VTVTGEEWETVMLHSSVSQEGERIAHQRGMVRGAVAKGSKAMIGTR
jgi:hypothetical protein